MYFFVVSSHRSHVTISSVKLDIQMHQIEVHHNIHRIMALFYRFGFWHHQNEESVGQRRLKLFYLIYYCLFPISFMAEVVTCDGTHKKIFSVWGIIVGLVLLIKLWIIVWRRSEILELLNGICVYCIDDLETFNAINNKLKALMKSVTVLVIIFLCSTTFFSLGAPLVNSIISTERILFLPIGFPLDWKTNDFAYGMVLLFVCTEVTISTLSLLFSVIIWYLLANCGWRYEVLGQQMKKLSEIRPPPDEIEEDEHQVSDDDKDTLYLQNLVQVITLCNDMKGLIKTLDSFLSQLFAVQLTTSALSICTSVYCIAFIKGDNCIELAAYLFCLVYNILDIFMILFFGNEIKLTSDKLSYHLYESDWIDRSQLVRRNVLIFSRFLMPPHQFIILKKYPLTLETFRRVLNLAYRLFNILKNFK